LLEVLALLLKECGDGSGHSSVLKPLASANHANEMETQSVPPEDRIRLAHPFAHMILLLAAVGAVQGALIGALGGLAWAVLTMKSAPMCLVITVMIAFFGAAVGGTVVGVFGAFCALCEWFGNPRRVEEQAFSNRVALVKNDSDQRFSGRDRIAANTFADRDIGTYAEEG
jgi:hypothetical protein